MHQKLKLNMNPCLNKLGDISSHIIKITAIKLYKYEIIHTNSKNILAENIFYLIEEFVLWKSTLFIEKLLSSL